jgi:hypothetical protein
MRFADRAMSLPASSSRWQCHFCEHESDEMTARISIGHQSAGKKDLPEEMSLTGCSARCRRSLDATLIASRKRACKASLTTSDFRRKIVDSACAVPEPSDASDRKRQGCDETRCQLGSCCVCYFCATCEIFCLYLSVS